MIYRRISTNNIIFVFVFLAGVGYLLYSYFADQNRRLESLPREVTPRGSLADFEETTISIFKAAAPSVVYIFTENAMNGFFGPQQTSQGTGSGFLWDQKGHVVTNLHVLEGARRIKVRLDSGKAIDAAFIGGSPGHDLAVIRLRSTPSDIKPIPVGSAANLKVGQSVLAIGNPFGLSRSLTTGVISALNRRLPTSTGREVVGAIQTDAAINPGNSGGPLIDTAGRLIGVNTAIISNSGASAGIGFAVPVDVVNRVVPQLIATGKIPRPGIGFIPINDEIAARLGVTGVIIDRVIPDSEAQRAGLVGIDYRNRSLGDVIISVENEPVRDMAEYIQALEQFKIGQTITIQVLRGDTIREFTVTLADVS